MEATAEYRGTGKIDQVFIFLFFFNTFLLPQGITFTLLLTPVWLYLLHISNRLCLLKFFLIPLAVYACIHIWLGVDLFYYAISECMLVGIGICCLAAWQYLKETNTDFDGLFKRIVQINFFFVLISIPLLFVPALKSSVWYVMSMSPNIPVIPRLKLFTYEASHYSYLLAPIAIYYYCRAVYGNTDKLMPALFAITVPLILSLSFGVLSCLLLSGIIILVVFFRSIFSTQRKRIVLLSILVLLAFAAVILTRYFPDNFLFVRFRNMLDGTDTSTRGRTYESFILAHKVIAQKSYWWGLGPGQLKISGRTIIVQYYYYSKIPDTIRIPNACAETIVYFGYMGFVIRIGAQLLLFYATRVYRSPYRLWLFLFLFFFQFMGSYITNITEYIFWMMAFSPAFNFFSVKHGQDQVKLG